MEKLMLFITPLILWALAFIIGTGKANFLIAGYNTSPKHIKDRYNKIALAKFMRKFLFILGLIQLILPIATLLNLDGIKIITYITIILFILATIGGVIYMNTGNRFKN